MGTAGPRCYERSSMSRRAPFRITHLSDLHLTGRDDAARSEPRLFGRLEGMNESFRALVRSAAVQRSDLLLVTGDVTDTGDLSAWKVFWSAIDEAGLRRRCLVVPGNHDVCNLGVVPPSRRGKRVQRDLERARQGLSLGNQPLSFPWARKVAPGTVIFGLDSCNPGNLTGMTNAVGELGYAQLERMARLLHSHRDVPVKLVALHHSPNIPHTATARRRGVERMSPVMRWGHEVPSFDRRALRLLCVAHKVRLIVHGHLHRAEDRRVNGIRIVGCPASTEPDEAGAYPFYRYTVGAGGRVSVALQEVELRP
jgi:3',5'-cyclic AMP phosphodiesterase CpdA